MEITQSFSTTSQEVRILRAKKVYYEEYYLQTPVYFPLVLVTS